MDIKSTSYYPNSSYTASSCPVYDEPRVRQFFTDINRRLDRFVFTPLNNVYQWLPGPIRSGVAKVSRCFHSFIELRATKAAARQAAFESSCLAIFEKRRKYEIILDRVRHKIGKGAYAMEAQKAKNASKDPAKAGNGFDFGFTVEYPGSAPPTTQRLSVQLYYLERMLSFSCYDSQAYGERLYWDQPTGPKATGPDAADIKQWVRVRTVVEGSPAALAGLQAGDWIKLPEKKKGTTRIEKIKNYVSGDCRADFLDKINFSNDNPTKSAPVLAVDEFEVWRHDGTNLVKQERTAITGTRTWRVPIDYVDANVVNAYAYPDITTLLEGIPVVTFLYRLWKRTLRFRRIAVFSGLMAQIESDIGKNKPLKFSAKATADRKLEFFVAVVMAHEAAHHKQQHFLKRFFLIQIINYLANLISLPWGHVYCKASRDHEAEADVYGLYMMANCKEYRPHIASAELLWQSWSRMQSQTRLERLSQMIFGSTHPSCCARQSMLGDYAEEIQRVATDDSGVLLPKEKDKHTHLQDLIPSHAGFDTFG